MNPENENTIKDVLKNMIDSYKWNERLNETKVRQLWSEKMGTTINQYTRELKLRKGKIYISIDSASLKQELSYEREKIVAMMNHALGGEYIKDVIIR